MFDKAGKCYIVEHVGAKEPRMSMFNIWQDMKPSFTGFPEVPGRHECIQPQASFLHMYLWTETSTSRRDLHTKRYQRQSRQLVLAHLLLLLSHLP